MIANLQEDVAQIIANLQEVLPHITELHDVAARVASLEEEAARIARLQEEAGQEDAAQEHGGEELGGQEQPSQDHTAREYTTLDASNVARKPPAQEKPAGVKATPEISARQKAGLEKAARKRAAREKADRDGVALITSGTYHIWSVSRREVISLARNTLGSPIELEYASTSSDDRQSWVVEVESDDTFTIRNKHWDNSTYASVRELASGQQVRTARTPARWRWGSLPGGTQIFDSSYAWQATAKSEIVLKPADAKDRKQRFEFVPVKPQDLRLIGSGILPEICPDVILSL